MFQLAGGEYFSPMDYSCGYIVVVFIVPVHTLRQSILSLIQTCATDLEIFVRMYYFKIDLKIKNSALHCVRAAVHGQLGARRMRRV